MLNLKFLLSFYCLLTIELSIENTTTEVSITTPVPGSLNILIAQNNRAEFFSQHNIHGFKCKSLHLLDTSICFQIKLITLSYGSEISWTLGTCSSDTTYIDNQEYLQQCCLSPGNYSLQCIDSYGDGWNGGYIEVDSTRHCQNFSSGALMTVDVNWKIGTDRFMFNKYI